METETDGGLTVQEWKVDPSLSKKDRSADQRVDRPLETTKSRMITDLMNYLTTEQLNRIAVDMGWAQKLKYGAQLRRHPTLVRSNRYRVTQHLVSIFGNRIPSYVVNRALTLLEMFTTKRRGKAEFHSNDGELWHVMNDPDLISVLSPKNVCYSRQEELFERAGLCALDKLKRHYRAVLRNSMTAHADTEAVRDHINDPSLPDTTYFVGDQLGKTDNELVKKILERLNNVDVKRCVDDATDYIVSVARLTDMVTQLQMYTAARATARTPTTAHEDVVYTFYKVEDTLLTCKVQPTNANSLVKEKKQRYIVGDIDHYLTHTDAADLRLNYRLMSSIAEDYGDATFPSYTAILKPVFDVVDKAFEEFGNAGCLLLKEYESLILGCLLKKFDGPAKKIGFVNEMVKAVKESLDDFSLRRVSMTDDTQPERDEQYRKYCGIIDEFVEVVTSCVGNFQHGVELYGCNRAFPYGLVDRRKSYLKAQKTMQQPQKLSEYGLKCCAESVGFLNRRIAVRYLEKRQVFPPIKNLDVLTNPLLKKWFTDGTADLNLVNENSPSLEDWAQVQIAKIYEFDYIINVSQMMIDKAISLTLSEFPAYFNSDLTGFRVETTTDRRLLLQLMREAIDTRKVVEDFVTGKLSENDLIMTLSPKERTPDIIAAREYGFTTMKTRCIPSIADRNVKEKPYKEFPEITLGLPLTELKREFMRMTKDARLVWRFIIADYKKWCQHKKHSNTSMLTFVLDNLFGFDPENDKGYYSKIQTLYGNMLYVHNDNLDPFEAFRLTDDQRTAYNKLPRTARKRYIDELVLSVRKKARDTLVSVCAMTEDERDEFFRTADVEPFYSNEAGVEGQSQGWWGLDSALDILSDVDQFKDMVVRLLASGDNIVIAMGFRPPPECPVGAEKTEQWSDHFDQRADQVFEVLLERNNARCKPMKRQETVMLRNFYVYGKTFVDVDGTIYHGVTKRGARITEKLNDLINDLGKRMGTMYSSGLEAAHQCGQEVVGYIISSMRACFEHVKELCVPQTNIRDDSPVSWNLLGETMPHNKGPNKLRDIVEYTVHIPSSISHLPVPAVSSFAIRQFPSPSSRDITDVYIQGSHPTDHSVYARAVYRCLSDQKVLVAKPCRDASAHMADPSALNINNMQDVNTVERETLRSELRERTTNKDYKPMHTRSMDADRAKLTKVFSALDPYSPRIVSAHFGRTTPGESDIQLSKFNATSTAYHLTDTNTVRSKSHDLSQKNLKKRLAMYSEITSYHVNTEDDGRQLECPSVVEARIREASWPYKNKMVNMITPDPIHSWSYKTLKTGEVLDFDATSVVLTCDVSRQKTATPGKLFDEVAGPNDGYVGSATSSGTVGGTLNSLKSDTALHSAERETTDSQWYAVESGKFRQLSAEIVQSRTEFTFEFLAKHGPKRTRGTDAHRVSDPRTPTDVGLNACPSFTTTVTFTTDPAGPLARDPRQWMILYQAVICHGLALMSRAYTGTKLEDVPAITHVVATPRCPTCMIPASMEKYDLRCQSCAGTGDPCPHIVVPRLKAYPDSRVLYAPKHSNVGNPGVELSQFSPVVTVRNDPLSSNCIAESVMASIVYSNTQAGRASNIYPKPESKRKPPVLSYRDFSSRNLYLFLNSLAYEHAMACLRTHVRSMSYMYSSALPYSKMRASVHKRIGQHLFHDLVNHVQIKGVENEFREIMERYGVGYGAECTVDSICTTLRSYVTDVVLTFLGDPSSIDALTTERLYFVGRECVDTRPVVYRYINYTCILYLAFCRKQRTIAEFANLSTELDTLYKAASHVVDAETLDSIFIDASRSASSALSRWYLTSDCPSTMSVCTVDPRVFLSLFSRDMDPNDTIFVGESVQAPSGLTYEARHLGEAPLPKPTEAVHTQTGHHNIVDVALVDVHRHAVSMQSLGVMKHHHTYSDYRPRFWGYVSGAYRKYALLQLLKSFRHRVVVGLASGGATELNMFGRDPGTKYMYYLSLHPQDEFIEGKAQHYVPPGLYRSVALKKVKYLTESVVGPNDLCLLETLYYHAVLLTKFHQGLQRATPPLDGADLVLNDLYLRSTSILGSSEVTRELYNSELISSALACIILCAGGAYVRKVFTASPRDLHAVLSAGTLFFATCSMFCISESSSRNTEWFVVYEQPKIHGPSSAEELVTLATQNHLGHVTAATEYNTCVDWESFQQSTVPRTRPETRLEVGVGHPSRSPEVTRLLHEYGRNWCPNRGPELLGTLLNSSFAMMPDPRYESENNFAGVCARLGAELTGVRHELKTVFRREVNAAQTECNGRRDRFFEEARNYRILEDELSDRFAGLRVLHTLFKKTQKQGLLNSVEYDTVVLDVLKQPLHTSRDTNSDETFYLHITPERWCEKYARRSAIIYGAYCCHDIQEYLSKEHVTSSPYFQTGQSFTDFDSVELGRRVARAVVVAVEHLLFGTQHSNYEFMTPVNFTPTGLSVYELHPKAGLLSRELILLARRLSKKLTLSLHVSRTNMGTWMSRCQQYCGSGLSVNHLGKQSFADAASNMKAADVVLMDIPWNKEFAYEGRAFVHYVESCVKSGSICVYTSSTGHHWDRLSEHIVGDIVCRRHVVRVEHVDVNIIYQARCTDGTRDSF